jgi:hypothetical protein
MRHGVGLFGLVCSVIVIAVAARYGFKTSDNEFDGYIWGFIYASITFGGLGGHMVGVRLWRYGKHVFALVIFATSLLALLISLSNSLGAMAGRMNTTQATRIQTADTVRDARRDLKRAEDEREGLKFKPTDPAAVDAAKIKAEAATKARATECQGYQDNACRKKQDAEAKALSELAEISQAKTATDHARELDAEIKALKAKIEAAGPVLEANSQGNALARLFALPEGDAARLSTYQNLAMAIGIEILIVLSLIAFEVMSEHERERMPKPAPASAPEAHQPIAAEAVAIKEPAKALEKTVEAASMMEALSIEEEPKVFPAPPKPRLITSRPDPVGSVVEIMAEIMEPGRGKVELADMFSAYAEACEAHGKRPIPANEFPAALADLCKRLGIKTEITDKGAYLLKVRLKASTQNAEAEG